MLIQNHDYNVKCNKGLIHACKNNLSKYNFFFFFWRKYIFKKEKKKAIRQFSQKPQPKSHPKVELQTMGGKKASLKSDTCQFQTPYFEKIFHLNFWRFISAFSPYYYYYNYYFFLIKKDWIFGKLLVRFESRRSLVKSPTPRTCPCKCALILNLINQ